MSKNMISRKVNAVEDFLRLAKSLRSMIFDFAKAKEKGWENANGAYRETPDAIVQDDVDILSANLTTSRVKNTNNMHQVVLDLDYDAALIPSSTPGHHHLILDTVLPWEEYKKLLEALAEAGIIQEGYAKASIAKGYSAIRTPWTKKEDTEPEKKKNGFDILEGIL